ETTTLLRQSRFRIGGALVSRVRAFFTAEVNRWVATVIGRFVRGRLVLGPEALEAGGGFDQRAVNGEVLVREQPQRIGLAHHRVEELHGDDMLQQPTSVLAERRLVEAGFHQTHVQKPPPQQLEVQFFTKGTFAAHRVQADQQRRLEQSLWWDRRPPASAVHHIEGGRQLDE